MKAFGSYFLSVVVALIVLAAVAPALIGLSHALVPVVIVLAVALVVCRLAFFHTRRF